MRIGGATRPSGPTRPSGGRSSGARAPAAGENNPALVIGLIVVILLCVGFLAFRSIAGRRDDRRGAYAPPTSQPGTPDIAPNPLESGPKGR